jgi:hypothetical protein
MANHTYFFVDGIVFIPHPLIANIGKVTTCHAVSINTKTDGREVAHMAALADGECGCRAIFGDCKKSVEFHGLATMQFHIPHI